MKMSKVTIYAMGILSAFSFSTTFATTSNISKERKHLSKAEELHTTVQAKLLKDNVDITRTADREADELGFANPKAILQSLKPREAKVRGEFLIYIVKRTNDRGNQKDLYIKFTKDDLIGWKLISFHKQGDENHVLEARRKQAVQHMLATPPQAPANPKPSTSIVPRRVKLNQQGIKDPTSNP